MSRNHEQELYDDGKEDEVPAQGTPDDLASEDEPFPAERPSQKQIRANRENAKKSTGPRTEAGKKRSSQNARKHGIFVAKIEPVQDGPIGEDPDEFYERVEMLVDSMAPRDPLEVEVATRIAGVLVKLERLDRWSAVGIRGASSMGPADFDAGVRTEARAQIWKRSAKALYDYLREPAGVEYPEFAAMATLLRFRGPKADVRIDGFWDDENSPASREDWQRAFEALKDALWSDDQDAEDWALMKWVELQREFEQVENLEERIAVNRIMNGPFALQLKYEAQLLNSLRLLRREYAELQKRDLG